MPPRAAAFTLLEMIVVLAIAALVIGMGASAVQRVTEEHQMLKVAHEAEGVLMQAMTRTVATAQGQQVNLDELGKGMKLTVKRAGADIFIASRNQFLFLRPGGLCEPLTLRWQQGDAAVTAVLDPLTATFQELEETP
jgi:prepilin-type N-terminal cleavage/methylation domain-containing protein